MRYFSPMWTARERGARRTCFASLLSHCQVTFRETIAKECLICSERFVTETFHNDSVKSTPGLQDMRPKYFPLTNGIDCKASINQSEVYFTLAKNMVQSAKLTASSYISLGTGPGRPANVSNISWLVKLTSF